MKRSTVRCSVAIGCVIAWLQPQSARAAGAGLIDRIDFGVTASESSHAVAAPQGEHVTGLLGALALRLLPPAAGGWEGPAVAFTIKVDPGRLNYFTARFSGSEASRSRLILFCEGKQVGYRHLGDIDILDFGSEENGGCCPGRFYYITGPLPMEMTRGKSELHCEIRATGPIWGYGATFDAYQKPMTVPTRGIYAVYTHTDAYFEPPADGPQGTAPSAGVRAAPGPEVLEAVKKRCSDTLTGILRSKEPINQIQMHLLARAYHMKWTAAYNNPDAIRQIVRGLDALQVAFEADRKAAQNGPGVYNGDWVGLGLAGDALRLTATDMRGVLDLPAEGSTVIRRAGWSAMLQASRDYHRANRRLYTNQSMITDLNTYRANRGVAAIDPDHAMPEPQIRRYLYESVGLESWRDSDTDVPGFPARRSGVTDNYMQLTAKGLTRELGYVGYYGEVIDWATQIYDATRDPGKEGDPKLKAQLERIAAARAVFRYPACDGELNRAMRIETAIGWRDAHNPGDITYGERPSWESTALLAVAATMDDASLGYAKQMLDDNQFFDSLERTMTDKSLRTTAGLLAAPDQYDAVVARVKRDGLPKLPMSPGEPDFVFTDEDDGVVAIKDGGDILYASLYWRARNAVNFLARIHYLRPRFDRIVTAHEEAKFDDSGEVFTRPDYINFGFGNGGPKYPNAPHSANAGEKLPIAAPPKGITIRPGDESVYAGRANLYMLQYGPYWIAMNCSDRPQIATTPPGQQWTDLASHHTVIGQLTLPPKTTRVLKADASTGNVK